MPDDVYFTLREFLDEFPRGFIETKSGVEIKILEKLFTKAEARLTVKLKRLPEELGKLAKRLGEDRDDLRQRLDAMADRGLIFRFSRNGKPYYRAAPFMIGLYEYSIKRIDKELAALFREYYEAGYIKALGSHNVPGFKVIPVEKSIPTGTTLLPYQQLERSVRSARRIAVTDCICRYESKLLGEGCHHPMETCLSFGAAAEYYIEAGLGREISADEAVKILEESDESGLVHAGVNSAHLSNICNCCPCCCAALKAITRMGSYRQRHFNAVFEAIVDEANCNGCETCLDRCAVNAIRIEEEIATVDRERCLGCGLCATTCAMEAINLVPREDGEPPFESVLDLWNQILRDKGQKLLSPSQ